MTRVSVRSRAVRGGSEAGQTASSPSSPSYCFTTNESCLVSVLVQSLFSYGTEY